MNRGMTVNGEYRDWVRVIRLQVDRIAPLRRKTLEFSGRPGGVPQGFETGVRQIQAVVDFDAPTKEQWLERLDDLMKLLIQDEPYPIQFEQEGKWTYFAELDGGIETKEIVTYGQVTLNWICADPYKYGYTSIVPFEDGLASVINNGTVNAYPRITARVKPGQQLTHIQLFDPDSDKYFQIGRPAEIGVIVRDKEERLLNDPADSLVGWASTDNTVDGGVAAGSMTTNGYSFSPLSFGTGATWHGPAIRKNVPQAPVTDFKIRMNIIMRNPSIGARGRLELYLRDGQGAVIGKFGMKRTGGGAYGNSVEARAGGESDFHYFVSNYGGASGIEWRNFEGVLELTRINNVWELYVALVDPVTKKQHTRYRSTPWKDTQLQYNTDLASITLHMAQNGTAEPVDMYLGNLEVFRINAITEMEIPAMANEGDELVLDLRTKEILLNGEPRKDLKAFGANFFSLEPGTHTIQIEPADKLEAAELEIREGFR